MARGDVLWIELPPPLGGAGREQAGRRPGIAIQVDDSTPTLVIVPITSQLSAERFPHTVRIDPSPENGLSRSSVLLVFQIRALDRARIQSRVGHLEDRYLAEMDKVLKRMLGL